MDAAKFMSEQANMHTGSISPEASRVETPKTKPTDSAVTSVATSSISTSPSVSSVVTSSPLTERSVSPVNSEPSFLSKALSTLGKVATIVGFVLCLPVILPVLLITGTSAIDWDNDGGRARDQREARRELENSSPGYRPNEPALTFDRSGRGWHPRTDGQTYNDLLERAGIPPRVTRETTNGMIGEITPDKLVLDDGTEVLIW